jgi:hypothetical protein
LEVGPESSQLERALLSLVVDAVVAFLMASMGGKRKVTIAADLVTQSNHLLLEDDMVGSNFDQGIGR